jgi:hypothetical protein
MKTKTKVKASAILLPAVQKYRSGALTETAGAGSLVYPRERREN